MFKKEHRLSYNNSNRSNKYLFILGIIIVIYGVFLGNVGIYLNHLTTYYYSIINIWIGIVIICLNASLGDANQPNTIINDDINSKDIELKQVSEKSSAIEQDNSNTSPSYEQDNNKSPSSIKEKDIETVADQFVDITVNSKTTQVQQEKEEKQAQQQQQQKPQMLQQEPSKTAALIAKFGQSVRIPVRAPLSPSPPHAKTSQTSFFPSSPDSNKQNELKIEVTPDEQVKNVIKNNISQGSPLRSDEQNDEHCLLSASITSSSKSSTVSSSRSRSQSKSPDKTNEDLNVKTTNKIEIINNSNSNNNHIRSNGTVEIKQQNNEFKNGNLQDDVEIVDNKIDSINNMKYRSNTRKLIIDIYNSKTSSPFQNVDMGTGQQMIEGYLDILPHGNSQKNSILLTWKRRYFKLTNGSLYIYEDKESKTTLDYYNLMGGKVDYEDNRVICIDDSRGNCIVLRCNDDIQYQKWKNSIDIQIVDRSQSLWMRPGLVLEKKTDRKVLILDFGTCSVRAGVFSNEVNLPQIFMPNVCSRDTRTQKYRVGFDAFNLEDASTPKKSSDQLIFPLKPKHLIGKTTIDIDCIEAIIENIVKELKVNCEDYEVLLVTPQKFGDKITVQFINLLFDKFSFKSVTLINQILLILYAYNCTSGIIVNLGEKIDIMPISNGMTFQAGATSLAFGGSTMSEYLNSFVSRAHYNYVNDIEQYLVRYVKENSCYCANNYTEELKKPVECTVDLSNYDVAYKKISLDVARFQSTEGLFNPEIWGIDGQGIHKLIFKAIQSCSMDLRRVMARSIYLAGGMSNIPGLCERLEKEMKALLPSSINVKINCSPHSYHCSYLGAFKLIQQPEYEKLLITKDEWSRENVNCLRKWRMM